MPVFEQSAGLRAILEKEGWTLFERVEARDYPSMDFAVVERAGPAAQYEVGKTYYLLPSKPGIKDVLGHVRSPTLFMGRQINLGKYCVIEFTPTKVLLHGAGKPIELPNAIVVSAFREGFCKTPRVWRAK